MEAQAAGVLGQITIGEWIAIAGMLITLATPMFELLRRILSAYRKIETHMATSAIQITSHDQRIRDLEDADKKLVEADSRLHARLDSQGEVHTTLWQSLAEVKGMLSAHHAIKTHPQHDPKAGHI